MQRWTFPVIVTVALLTACGTSPAVPVAAARPLAPMARSLAPMARSLASTTIYNFARVNDRLYRGGQPNEPGLQALVRQGIKSVVSFQSLPDEKPIVAQEEAAARRLGLKWVHMPVAIDAEPTEAFVRTFFAYVQDPANQPCYVHCRAGMDRTGMMVAVYRIQYEGLSVAKAVEDEKSFGHKMGEFPQHDAYVARFKPFALPVAR